MRPALPCTRAALTLPPAKPGKKKLFGPNSGEARERHYICKSRQERDQIMEELFRICFYQDTLKWPLEYQVVKVEGGLKANLTLGQTVRTYKVTLDSLLILDNNSIKKARPARSPCPRPAHLRSRSSRWLGSSRLRSASSVTSPLRCVSSFTCASALPPISTLPHVLCRKALDTADARRSLCAAQASSHAPSSSSSSTRPRSPTSTSRWTDELARHPPRLTPCTYPCPAPPRHDAACLCS